MRLPRQFRRTPAEIGHHAARNLLRDDYPLGLLNGTRAVVEQVDTTRQEMTLTTTYQTTLVLPFAYAEAVHLTHGYGTTIHKAQGATVDRCYVLGDDTLTREYAYTALSRGRHHNELYVVAEDRRVEDRHAVEVKADPLDAVRHAIRRSGAKRLAVDQTRPQPGSLKQLRQERDQVRAILDAGPVDPSREIRRVTEAIRSEKNWRDGGQWRLNHEIRSTETIDRIHARARERGAGHDLGIEL